MITLASLQLAREVLALQQLPASAPDLVQTAIALTKAITELDAAILAHNTNTNTDVEVSVEIVD